MKFTKSFSIILQILNAITIHLEEYTKCVQTDEQINRRNIRVLIITLKNSYRPNFVQQDAYPQGPKFEKGMQKHPNFGPILGSVAPLLSF
jgi:hypothetical protein